MTVLPQPISVLRDQLGREKRKLRVSVTDRCNFRCVYCMPDHPQWMAKHEMLSLEALFKFCEVMVRHGIEEIRVTGGEPLMRRHVTDFINQLNDLRARGLRRVSMTTNGFYLAEHAAALKAAGLDDINISLDSLSDEQFLAMTQAPLRPVIEGIYEAQAQGLALKLNAVLIKGRNDDQILPLTAWARALQVPLRFIEYMPLDGSGRWHEGKVVTEAEILSVLRQVYKVQALPETHEPARKFRLNNEFDIGIISTISNAFCARCDRLRITAKGDFHTCLFSTHGINLREPIQQAMTHDDDSDLLAIVKHAVFKKEAGFVHSVPLSSRIIPMHVLGG